MSVAAFHSHRTLIRPGLPMWQQLNKAADSVHHDSAVRVWRAMEDADKTLLAGRLAVAPSSTLDSFRARDRSERGARLMCRTGGIDDDVTLELKAAGCFQEALAIAWRRLEDCGVEFIALNRILT